MINVIIGTKAELIKMSPVMRELQKRKVEYNYIDTSQHSQTTSKFRKDFQVKEPDAQIGGEKNITTLMQGAGWAVKTAARLFDLKVLKEKKGLSLVIGDTATTFLGAYCSKAQGLKVGHIEAGLRSFNYLHPFPEELIRLWVSKVSDYMFAPYAWAFNNLEKYPGKRFNTRYNTILDTIRYSLKKNRKPKGLPKKYCMITTHRFETIFNRKRLEKILGFVEQAAEQVPAVFVMHEPTRKRLIKYKLLSRVEKNENISIAPLMHYFEWIQAEKNAEFMMIDGGSIQEESYYINTPCCLLRNATERREGLGENVLISGLDGKKISGFLENYKSLKRKPIKAKFSPSSFIVGKILEMEKEWS
ncbi:MAG TPA: UDP-N-acetyl glucosamine 2-epimerase [Candidatus Diapherotrites archaeon]|uniref:UDP-N-acetyl glucosamine 2-epimerase n=1 Tax=Candidatus Iainarchaeum sp. TaxID=3101447 RepID=A0A7J4KU95_9ARCH|nr:UDP-N-acetyl glucosamine 2-epimerase [Candidatus Diapherotrites archaeon]